MLLSTTCVSGSILTACSSAVVAVFCSICSGLVSTTGATSFGWNPSFRNNLSILATIADSFSSEKTSLNAIYSNPITTITPINTKLALNPLIPPVSMADCRANAARSKAAKPIQSHNCQWSGSCPFFIMFNYCKKFISFYNEQDPNDVHRKQMPTDIAQAGICYVKRILSLNEIELLLCLIKIIPFFRI